MIKTTILIITLTALGLGCGGGGGGHNHHGHGHHGHDHGADAPPPKEVQISAKAMKQFGIRVEPVGRRTLQPTFAVPARVAVNEETTAHVGTLVSGRVSEMRVHIGDTVKQGDVLFIIESPELGAAQNAFLQALDAEAAARPAVALARNNAGVAKAEADIAAAQAQVKLAANPAVIHQAQAELAAARASMALQQNDAAITEAKAEVAAAQAALALAQNSATVAQAEGKLAAAVPVQKRAAELVVTGKKLVAAKALSQKELQRREAELATATAEVNAATAALAQAKAEQERGLKAAQANVTAKQAALALAEAQRNRNLKTSEAAVTAKQAAVALAEAQQIKDQAGAQAKLTTATATLKAAQAAQAKELGEAQSALNTSGARVAATRNKLGLLGMTAEAIAALAELRQLTPHYSAVAPRAGTVVEREVTQGESVSPDQPHLLMLADLSKVWVVMDTPPAHAAALRTQLAISLRNETTGTETAAQLDYVSPTVDAETRTVSARVELDNASGRWRPGQFLTALVPTGGPASDTLAVPAEAVQYVDGKPVVYDLLQKENTFKQVTITVGAMVGGWVPVTGGLSESAKIVTTGSFVIKAEFGKAKAGHDHSH